MPSAIASPQPSRHGMVLRRALRLVLLGAFLGHACIGKASEDDPFETKIQGPATFDTVQDHDHAEPRVDPPVFNGIQPGKSLVGEVKQAWGDPTEAYQDEDGKIVSVYRVSTFDHVEIRLDGGTVSSIVIRLDKPIELDLLAKELNLKHIVPVDVPDEAGRAIGRAFPERGVLFTFAAQGGTSLVKQVVLEPIDPESFVLRAESRLHGPYTANLADLKYALQRDTSYAHAHWLYAEVLLAVGRPGEAERAAASAVGLKPDVPEYRVTWARCLARAGQHARALEESGIVLGITDLPALVKARALAFAGDLATKEGVHDCRESVRLHMEAIKSAEPLAMAPDQAVRLAAKEICIDAHLAVARDIAWGRWQQKDRVVPMWIERAKQHANEAIDQEGGSPELRLRVAENAMLAMAGFQSPEDPANWVRAAEKAAAEVSEAMDDPLWKQRIDRQLGLTYFRAMQVEHNRGQAEQGLKFGKLALERLDRSPQDPPLVAEDEHVQGQLFFQMGAMHAVHLQDHREAIRWYEKAAPVLIRPGPVSALTDPKRHGDALISMGVSYWEVDQKEKAIELTKMGAELLQQAIRADMLGQAALAIPYANLATMLSHLGKTEEAQTYAKLAEKETTSDEGRESQEENAGRTARGEEEGARESRE